MKVILARKSNPPLKSAVTVTLPPLILLKIPSSLNSRKLRILFLFPLDSSCAPLQVSVTRSMDLSQSSPILDYRRQLQADIIQPAEAARIAAYQQGGTSSRDYNRTARKIPLRHFRT